MNLNKLIAFTFFLLFFSLIKAQNSQKLCNVEGTIKKVLIRDLQYEKITQNINLTKIISYKNIDFLGFIGKNKKRLNIKLERVERDNENPYCYNVSGYTTVSNKNYRKFKGYFYLEKSYKLIDKMYEGDEYEYYGLSILDYKLYENKEKTSTGVFKGKAIVFWSKNINNKYEYEMPNEGFNSSRNFQCFGYWTSYRKNSRVICCWGHYRIPCSGDLDIGASEFYPNEKYYKYGWKGYKP